MTVSQTSDSAAKAEAALAKYVDLARFGDGESDAEGLRMHFKYSRAGAQGDTTLILVHGLGLSYFLLGEGFDGSRKIGMRHLQKNRAFGVSHRHAGTPIAEGHRMGTNDSTQAYWQFLEANHLAEPLSSKLKALKDDGRNVAAIGKAVRKMILAADFPAEHGIDSISVSPDSFLAVKRVVAEAEAAQH